MPEDSVPESTPLCDQEWFPYRNQIEFEVADFIFRRNEMPQSQVDDLMNLWAAFCQLNNLDASPPFTNHQDLLDTIDSTPDGSIAWDCVKVSYCGNENASKYSMVETARSFASILDEELK